MTKHACVIEIILAALTIACSTASIPPQSELVRKGWIRQGNPPRAAAIVFVHGFGGNEATWRNSTQNVFWPELLTKDMAFDDADIYVATYPSSLLRSRFEPGAIAEYLRSDLDPILDRYGRIVFVAHSMGGLVVQEYLTRHTVEAAGRIQAIVYYATPGTGSDVATAANVMLKNFAVEQLSPRDGEAYLVNLQSRWRRTDLDEAPSYCAYETKNVSFMPMLIVKPLSASSVCNQPAVALDADHFRVVKPASKDDRAYTLLAEAYRQSESKTVRDEQTARAEETPVSRSVDSVLAYANDGRRLLDRDDAGLMLSDSDVRIPAPTGADITWASFSHNGQTVFYRAAEEGRDRIERIYRVTLRDTRATWFIDVTDADSEPAVSPDGGELALVRRSRVQSSPYSWQYVDPHLLIFQGGTEPVQELRLDKNMHYGVPAWSIDGSQIALPEDRGVAIIHRATMAKTFIPVTYGGYVRTAVWSPSGWLAVGVEEPSPEVLRSSSGIQLWQLRLDGTKERLTNDRASYRVLAFIGFDILAQRSVNVASLWVAGFDAPPRRIATNVADGGVQGAQMAWSSSAEIIFSADAGARDAHLVAVSPDTLQQRAITLPGSGDHDPVFANDGETLLFHRQRFDDWGLYVLPPKGAPWILGDYRVAFTRPSHPGGTELLIRRGPNTPYDVCPWMPGDRTVMCSKLLGRTLSPNITRVADRSVLYDAFEVPRPVIIAERDGQRRTITDQCSDPVVSPDGRQFIARCDFGQAAVFDIATGAIASTIGEDATEPAWSPDGRWIAYVTARGNTAMVRIRNADGGRVIDVASGDRWPFERLTWSRDSRMLAFVRRDAIVELHYIPLAQ